MCIQYKLVTLFQVQHISHHPPNLTSFLFSYFFFIAHCSLILLKKIFRISFHHLFPCVSSPVSSQDNENLVFAHLRWQVQHWGLTEPKAPKGPCLVSQSREFSLGRAGATFVLRFSSHPLTVSFTFPTLPFLLWRCCIVLHCSMVFRGLPAVLLRHVTQIDYCKPGWLHSSWEFLNWDIKIYSHIWLFWCN